MADLINFETKFRTEQIKALEKRVDKGIFTTLKHTAAAIRGTARRLIFKRKGPSPEGDPIHSPTGKAKRPAAILFSVSESEDSAVVGFNARVMSDAMGAQELGGEYRDAQYPERPTMGPALEIQAVRFADNFVTSFGD